MKKIKYFILMLAVGFSAVSCYDDDAITPVLPAGLDDITLTAGAPERNITAGGFNLPFSASIPSAFTSDVDVEASLTFDGGVTNSTVTIEAGSTSATGSITMQGTSGLVGNFAGKPVTLSLTGLLVTDPAEGDASVFNVTSNDVDITSYDLAVTNAYGESVISGRMTHLWEYEADYSVDDYDMFVFDTDGIGPYEVSTNGGRYEYDIFNDTWPDGDYIVVIEVWNTSESDIPWHLFFVDPDRTTLTFYEGVIPGAGKVRGDQIDIANFTKTTTVDADGDDVVSYTYSQIE